MDAIELPTFELYGPLPNMPPWLRRGFLERGQAEIAGLQHNPRILEYQRSTTLGSRTDESPWCSDFANWCFLPELVGTRSAAAKSWTLWGDALDAFRLGAVVVIFNAAAARSSLTASGYHVGFAVEETPEAFTLLGGNQGNRVSVARFSRQRWELRARRWPKGWPA